MAEINNYIYLSDAALSIKDIYSSPENFNKLYKEIDGSEQDSYLRHWLINNVPSAFKMHPILLEQLIQYISDHLSVSANDVKLIGSAKTGFSISPSPDYGKAFSEQSDLDFTVVNNSLFSELDLEFNLWAEEYKNKKLMPYTDAQATFWPQNLATCPSTLARGFIDVNKIPSYNQFFKAKLINQCLYLVKDKLEKAHNFKVKKASIRVYKNWNAFKRQLKINTESVLKTLE